MRILVVTPYFHPHSGGSQRYIEELYGAVMKLNPQIQVDVVTYNTEKVAKEELYKGMKIYRVGCLEILRGQFALPNYIELAGLLRRLKKNSYEVVNAHTRFFDTAWWGWLAAKYLGAKSILTDHCAYHPEHNNVLVRGMARLVDGFMIPVLGRVYDSITVVSKATSRFLTERGIGKKPMVIYGGVDIDLYEGERVVGEQVRVTFLGRMIVSKGPQLVMAVAQDLVKKYPNVTFTFAGDGPLYAELKSQELSRIQVLGDLSRKQVINLLHKSDVVVLPSTHHEGLPSVILEAGAAGCAVVTTDRGGVREVIEDRVSGLIVDPSGDKIKVVVESLIIDTHRRKDLGKRLQLRIKQKFTWEIIAKLYVDWLDSAV